MDINEKPLQVVIGIIGNSKGQFLLSTRRTKPIYDDYLEFPGGKVKPLETNEGALIRELREEVKITAEDSYATCNKIQKILDKDSTDTTLWSEYLTIARGEVLYSLKCQVVVVKLTL